MMRQVTRSALVVLMAFLFVACGGGTDDGQSKSTTPSSDSTTGGGSGDISTLSGNLTIFAAASLTAAFEAIATSLQEANPDLRITHNFAGSQQLVTQLVEGADADVFASANISQMDVAQEGGVVSSARHIFTRNRLVIVIPADNPGRIEQPADLAIGGLKIVVANEDVPVGRYTLEMLDLMSASPDFGSDFRDRVENNIVSLEDNVKQVVAKVQLGEADAGIAYVTDVTPDVAEDISLVELPEQFNIIAEYPVAPVAGGDSDLARAYINFLLSDAGQNILTSHGFTSLD